MLRCGEISLLEERLRLPETRDDSVLYISEGEEAATPERARPMIL